MNTFCLVGKIARLPKLEESPQGWKTCTVQMEVERPFANSSGVFETDLIDVEVWRGAAETLTAAARQYSWISARGRIQARMKEHNGQQIPSYQFIAEKIEYIH